MLFYGGAIGASAMFGRRRGGEVPFYVRGSGDEGHIIEVNYLLSLALECRSRLSEAYPKY